MLFQRTFAALALFCSAFSKATSDEPWTYPRDSLPLVTHTIAQLSSVPTWLKNLAVRKNGDLLVTQFAPAPVLYIHCRNTSDTFVIVGGNATVNATGYVGTFSAWEVKFSEDLVTVHKIVDIPEAMLNGVVALPDAPNVVLIADSQLGLLIRVDTRRATYEIIADRPKFKPRPERFNKTGGFGINGVKIRDRFLYFSNTNLVNVYRVPIIRDGYPAEYGKTPVEVYADLNAVTTFIDDFEIGPDGTVWAVSNDDNTLVAVTPRSREVEVVAGARDRLMLAGGTGAAFGRTKRDKHVLYLYINTAGGPT